MKRKTPPTQAMNRPKRQKSQLAITQEIVKKELRKKVDWKYTDNSQATTNVTSTGALTSVFANLVRGDLGKDNFGGNQIMPQALLLKYYFVTSQVYNSVRIMVVQWFDAATPGITGILESGATSLATIAPVLITNKNYVKVLYDQTHLLAPTAYDAGSVAGYGTVQPVKVYIPGKKLRPVRFNSGTDVVQDGNIYVLLISDDSLTAYPTVTWYSRVTFQDND